MHFVDNAAAWKFVTLLLQQHLRDYEHHKGRISDQEFEARCTKALLAWCRWHEDNRRAG